MAGLKNYLHMAVRLETEVGSRNKRKRQAMLTMRTIMVGRNKDSVAVLRPRHIAMMLTGFLCLSMGQIAIGYAEPLISNSSHGIEMDGRHTQIEGRPRVMGDDKPEYNKFAFPLGQYADHGTVSPKPMDVGRHVGDREKRSSWLVPIEGDWIKRDPALIELAQSGRLGDEMPIYPSEWDESFDFSGGSSADGGGDNPYPTLGKTSLDSMKLAVNRLAGVVAQGGWPKVPSGTLLKIGVRDRAVSILRHRLALGGDLQRQAGRQDVFDSYVGAAVRRFQRRHGLFPDAVVGKTTFAALNVSAAERLQQLRVNMVRITALVEQMPQRYVLVNIPAQEVEAVENDRIVSRHVAIVGKPDRQSPILSARIHEVNFSPYWTVPRSIIRRDIIPQMRKDPTYLKRYVIRMFTHKNVEVNPTQVNWATDEAMNYVFRQDPGEDINSMGAVKLNFYNPHAVFLHDTPQKHLFSENYRAYSSGCIRVQNIELLLSWLLERNVKDRWSRAKVDAVIRSGERLDVALEKPTPIYMVYITAWAGPDGTAQFRGDVYNRDGLADTTAVAHY